MSDEGHVRSLPRPGRTRGRLLSVEYDKGGYAYFRPSIDGKATTMRVHHAVLAAFVGPKPDGALRRHLNGDPRDNRLVNLAYGTHSENVYDKVRHGTHHEAIKTHCPHGHEYTPENTYIRPGTNKRFCRECGRIRSRAYKKAKR